MNRPYSSGIIACGALVVLAGIASLVLFRVSGNDDLLTFQGQERRISGEEVRGLLAEARRQLATRPQDASLYHQLAILELMSTGRPQTAIPYMMKAVRFSPKDPYYRFALADMEIKSGEKGKALDNFLAAARLGEASSRNKEWTPIYHFYAARLLQDNDSYAQAEDQYERSLASLRAFAEEWGSSGMDNRNHRHDFGKVINSAALKGLKAVEGKMAGSRPNAEWLRKQFSIDSDWGWSERNESMIIDSLVALEKEPRSDVFWFNLGYGYLHCGRLKEACTAFDKAGGLGDKEAYVMSDAARSALARLAPHRTHM
jgi:tetratricopeptide (TPR) repeat protein